MKKQNISIFRRLTTFLWMLILSPAVLANSNSMPWQDSLNKVFESMQGLMAKSLGVATILIAGIGITFTKPGSKARKIFLIVFGLAATYIAIGLITAIFGI